MELIYEEDRIYSLGICGEVIAEITFPPFGPGAVNIDHTFVDASLRGQGIAAQLVQAAAETVRARKLKALATCSYASGWFASHPEYADILVCAKDR